MRVAERLGAFEHGLGRRSAAWAGALFIVAVCALVGFDIARGWRTTREDIARELDTHARILAEQTARSLQAVDVVLRHISQEQARGRLEPLTRSQLHAYLGQQSVGFAQIRGLAMHDAQGDALAISWLEPSTRINVAGAAVFQLLRERDDADVVIGAATRSPSDDQWMIPIARRLEHPGGGFAGIVAARVRIEYFADFYRDVRLEPGAVVTLLLRDGSLLLREPAVPQAFGGNFASIRATLQAQGERPARITSPIDGAERFAAMRALDDYPVDVMVARDVASALAPWRRQAIGSAARTLALAALAALLLAYLGRQLRHLDVARDRFALAVEGSDDGIWDWDHVQRTVFASARARELLGIAGPELHPMDEWFSKLRVHPDDAQGRLDALNAHLEGRAPAYISDYRALQPNGDYRWVRVRALCVRDANGHPQRMAGSVADIDALKCAEASLRESEERYSLAVAGSADGVWDWDFVNDRAFESRRARELQGLPLEPESQPLPELMKSLCVHPADRERRGRAMRAHLDGEVPAYECEYRVVPPDGAYRWVRVRAVCTRDGDGRPLRLAGSVSDIDARKRAEEALRMSEERYALAMTGSDEAHWVWDVHSDEFYASPRMREMYGIALDADLGTRRAFLKLAPLHPDDRDRLRAAFDDHLNGRTPRIDHEFRIVDHATGELRWLHTRAQCVRDAKGRPMRMGGSTMEITARKRAEEALRASEERFALAVAGAADGILDWDIVRDELFASPRALELMGVAPADVPTPPSRAAWAARLVPRVHPDDVTSLERVLDISPSQAGEAHEGEYRLRGADGRYRWLRFRGRSVRDEHGKPVRWAGSVSDIDALKIAEEALRRSEERYQLAVLGSTEGLWDWDMESDMLFLSARCQELLWAQVGEPLRPRREWIAVTRYHPDDVAHVRAAISAHLHGHTQHMKVEYRLRHHSGEWHWYRQRGVAVRDAQGRPYRMAGSMEDINDRKQAESERERLELQLRQSQRLEAMGTLAGGIAHDFNNILAAILGYGEMVQKRAEDGTALKRHIDAAMSAAMRAKSLVARILAFSRSGIGERVTVHVQSVVAEALDLALGSMPPGMRLERQLDAGDAAVSGDPTQIHQVVMNLCANAVQAMGREGSLRVRLARVSLDAPRSVTTSTLLPGRYVCLEVRDTGVGISPRVLERIFDPFFTTKEIGVGTGLGLSLVHGIVGDLGGGIDVESRLGEGSSMSVYLPCVGDTAAAVPEHATPPQGQGETVMLVDDEVSLVRLGEELLAELGYEPVGFTSATDALGALQEDPGRFDLILTDESMPEMTGSELALAARTIRADLPVLIMTGHVTNALSARAREAGVIEVMAKPLVAREIARSLAAALRVDVASAVSTT
jgi:PAS domain S-box-containing protein